MLRRISLTLLAATAIGVVASHAVFAADLRMPVKAPPVAPPPPVQDWSGVYVGVEGGYGWGRQQGFVDPFGLNPNAGAFCQHTSCFNSSSFGEFAEFQHIFDTHKGLADVGIGGVDQSGWLFGAFFGVQKQWGSWVLGLEADVDGADITASNSANTGRISLFGPQLGTDGEGHHLVLEHTASLDSKIDEVSSLRGKIGWAWSPNWMVYGTGGAAFAHVKNGLTSSACISYNDPGETDIDGCPHANGSGGGASGFVDLFTASSDQTMLGWTVGAGIDYKVQIDPGSAWVFGVEYQYMNFPTQTFTFTGPSGASVAFNTSESINIIKGRISYLFSIH